MLTGTIFQGTKIELGGWFAVVAAAASDGQLPSNREVQDGCGLSAEAARRVLILLTAAFALDPVRTAVGQAVGAAQD